jgi:hypothetical protein
MLPEDEAAMCSALPQAAVGTLLAKTLTTSTTNPYVGNPSSAYGTPAALDVFSVQVRQSSEMR